MLGGGTKAGGRRERHAARWSTVEPSFERRQVCREGLMAVGNDANVALQSFGHDIDMVPHLGGLEVHIFVRLSTFPANERLEPVSARGYRRPAPHVKRKIAACDWTTVMVEARVMPGRGSPFAALTVGLCADSESARRRNQGCFDVR